MNETHRHNPSPQWIVSASSAAYHRWPSMYNPVSTVIDEWFIVNVHVDIVQFSKSAMSSLFCSTLCLKTRLLRTPCSATLKSAALFNESAVFFRCHCQTLCRGPFLPRHFELFSWTVELSNFAASITPPFGPPKSRNRGGVSPKHVHTLGTSFAVWISVIRKQFSRYISAIWIFLAMSSSSLGSVIPGFGNGCGMNMPHVTARLLSVVIFLFKLS